MRSLHYLWQPFSVLTNYFSLLILNHVLILTPIQTHLRLFWSLRISQTCQWTFRNRIDWVCSREILSRSISWEPFPASEWLLCPWRCFISHNSVVWIFIALKTTFVTLFSAIDGEFFLSTSWDISVNSTFYIFTLLALTHLVLSKLISFGLNTCFGALLFFRGLLFSDFDLSVAQLLNN